MILALGMLGLGLTFLSSAAGEEAAEDSAKDAKTRLAELAAEAREGRSHFFFDLSDELLVTPNKLKGLDEQLVALLGDADPNVRLIACHLLGLSARPEFSGRLAGCLKDSDWRVCYVACLSAIELSGKELIPDLDRLAKEHWYPWVQDTAKYAIERLKGAKASEEQLREHADFATNGSSRLVPLAEDLVEKLAAVRPRIAIMSWERYPDAETDSREISFHERFPQLFAAIAQESPKGGNGEWGYHCLITDLKERNGTHFVAMDAGEWAGGLFAVKDGKAATLIGDDNVTAVVEWDKRLVAFAGVAHMSLDYGAVYEIVSGKDGWKAKYRYALPGCPTADVGVLPDGRLFANCNGGAVAISNDGRFTYLGSGSDPVEK